jgi:flagellar hook-length control protein FliK
MEVSITVRDGQASVHFGAAQAETRQLIEASIPRLREMLAAQGFNLMDASVSQGFSRQARNDAARVTSRDAEPEAETRTATRIESTRLLDTYA